MAALTADSTASYDLGGRNILFTVPRYEVGGIRINERFQPLVGVDLVWKGRIQTSLAWNKANSYSLSTTNFDLHETASDEFTMTGSYQRQGMKLPFFGGKRLNNRVSFSLTVSHAVLSDQRYLLRRALVDAINRRQNGEEWALEDAISGDNVGSPTGSTRLRISPQISYQFSNRVQGNFSLTYEQFQSEDSRQPSTSTLNGGFNVRVSIAN